MKRVKRFRLTAKLLLASSLVVALFAPATAYAIDCFCYATPACQDRPYCSKHLDGANSGTWCKQFCSPPCVARDADPPDYPHASYAAGCCQYDDNNYTYSPNGGSGGVCNTNPCREIVNVGYGSTTVCKDALSGNPAPCPPISPTKGTCH